MRCSRLTFENTRIFDVLIDAARVDGDPSANLCVALIYRVVDGAREFEPLQRQGGTPIQIHAVSPDSAVRIASEVLHQVTGSRLVSTTDCSGTLRLPPFVLGFGLAALLR